MIDFDEFDDIFRRIQNMINNEYSGGVRYRRREGNVREDNIDIQEDDKHIYITVELRVRDEDLTVYPQEDMIVLEVMIDGAWSRKVIRLPTLVNPKSAKISFNNFILDIVLKKIKEKKIDEQSRGNNLISKE